MDLLISSILNNNNDDDDDNNNNNNNKRNFLLKNTEIYPTFHGLMDVTEEQIVTVIVWGCSFPNA